MLRFSSPERSAARPPGSPSQMRAARGSDSAQPPRRGGADDAGGCPDPGASQLPLSPGSALRAAPRPLSNCATRPPARPAATGASSPAGGCHADCPGQMPASGRPRQFAARDASCRNPARKFAPITAREGVSPLGLRWSDARSGRLAGAPIRQFCVIAAPHTPTRRRVQPDATRSAPGRVRAGQGYSGWRRQVRDSNRRKLSQRCRTPLTCSGRAILAYQS